VVFHALFLVGKYFNFSQLKHNSMKRRKPNLLKLSKQQLDIAKKMQDEVNRICKETEAILRGESEPVLKGIAICSTCMYRKECPLQGYSHLEKVSLCLLMPLGRYDIPEPKDATQEIFNLFPLCVDESAYFEDYETCNEVPYSNN
jgi:hypothetical protein